MSWVIKKKTTVVAMPIVAMSVSAAYADDKFTGLYKGVDGKDGSIDHTSIVRLPDGRYDIRVSSTGLGVCEDGRAPGMVTAIGRAERRRLVREEVVATCLETGETIALSDGVYTLGHDDNVLTIEAVGGRTNHYHRITDD